MQKRDVAMPTTPTRLLSFILVLIPLGAVFGQAAGPSRGDRAPALGLEKLLQAPQGASASWEALKGRVVVLEFWATWCGPCVAAIPHLNELADKYAEKGVVFISITDEPPEVIEPLLKKKPMRSWVGLDTDRSMFEAYGVRGIPHTVLVGRDGLILAVTHPTKLDAQLLDDALAGREIRVPEPKGRSFVAGVDPDDASAEPPLYQVVIRPRTPGPTGMASAKGKLTLDGYTLTQLCAAAHQLRPQRVIMKVPGPSDQLYTAVIVTPEGREDQVHPMLGQALESTFGLRMRREARELEAYVLTVAESGLKLSEGASSARGTEISSGSLSAVGANMDDLTAFVERKLDKPVVDATGLTARYDVQLLWEEGNAESLIRALREQAGLVLTPAVRSIEVLVVEPVPAGN